MGTYKSLERDLIEIGGKTYRISTNSGDLWIVKELDTINFFIFDRSSENFFLIPKITKYPKLVLADLEDEAFTELSRFYHRCHLIMLIQCNKTKCSYAMDFGTKGLEVKRSIRLPDGLAELLFDPKGDLVGVYYEDLDVVHIQDGKVII